MTIHLVLTYHWFDEILAGRKDIEYRAIGGKWDKRIWAKRYEITHVRFQRAYDKNPATILRPVTKIDIGPCPYSGFDGDYYRIHLEPMDDIEKATLRDWKCPNCGHGGVYQFCEKCGWNDFDEASATERGEG